MSEVPPFFPEVKAHWSANLAALRGANELAEKNVKRLGDGDAENSSDRLKQAQLQQLTAAQTYNSFVDSGSQYIKMAQDAESRLQRRDLSLLEIVQLKTTRDTMYALSAEFVSFKADNQVAPMHLKPVETGGQIHYIDGRVEWSGSISGLAGQAWEGLQEIASGVKEALVRGPFTTEENYAICQSALGSLLPQLAGKTIAAPGGGPGEILWGEALGKALDAADPAGQMCRVVYPPGTSPQDAWRFGQVIEGFDPVANSTFTAVLFMPPEMAEAQVVSGFVETGMDQAWNELADVLGAFPGMDGLPRFDAADAWPTGGAAQDAQASNAPEGTADAADELGDELADFAPGIGSDLLWFRQAGLDAEAVALDAGEATAAEAWDEGASPGADGPLSVEAASQFSQLMDVLTNSMADFSPPAAGSPYPPATPYASVLVPVLASTNT